MNEKLDDGYRVNVMRFCMITFIFVLAITGIIAIITGAAVKPKAEPYSHFLDSTIPISCIALVTAGSFVFIIVPFGCYATINKSSALLKTFGVCVTVIFIVEISVAVLAFTAFRADALIYKLKYSRDNYYKLEEHKRNWDFLHQKFRCCGTIGVPSWRGFDVPLTCCHSLELGQRVDDYCIRQGSGRYIFIDGCLEPLRNKIRSYLEVLVGIAIGVAFLDVSGIALSFILAISVKEMKRKQEEKIINIHQ